MRLRITIDLTRHRPETPQIGGPPPGATDGGAQIEPAPDTAPGWNRVGFLIPSTHDDEPE